MKKVIIFFLMFFATKTWAQNKSGNTFIFGGGEMYAQFAGDTSRPITGQLCPLQTHPNYPLLFWNGTSNICDSATGKLLMMCNGFILYDTLGFIIENGDNLQPNNIYVHECCPAVSTNTQGSLILPKGNNGMYYVFVPTITDTTYSLYATSSVKFPYDLFQYHVVDMNANGGMGKVIQKNIPLLSNVEISKTGMMACRHANGHDWWLLKQALDTNMIYTFLVTKDTVVLDTIQGFATSKFGYYDLVGQSCFNTDGSKYAFATGGGYLNNKGAHLIIADFDRCYGILSNPKELHIPYDSTLTPLDNFFGPYSDSLITGIAFSQNDSFLYVNRRYNIYQYELNNPDSTLACNLIQHGPDTTFAEFVEYGSMIRAVDNRIYIGKRDGHGNQNSVIDHPNLKGSACGFCRKCLRYDTGVYTSNSPANMPDFNLGAIPLCPPLNVKNVNVLKNDLEVYPNPTDDKLFIKTSSKEKLELYNSIGQLLLKIKAREINVSEFPKGMYYIKVENAVRKLIIE